MHQTLTIQAGQRLEFFEVGDFFRLMNSGGPVTVEFYKNGREIAEAVSVGSGYGERFYADSFDRFVITSATTQSIQIAARMGGEVWYDTPPVGNVSVVSMPDSSSLFGNQVTAGSTAWSLVKPRNSARSLSFVMPHLEGAFVVDSVYVVPADSGSTAPFDGSTSPAIVGFRVDSKTGLTVPSELAKFAWWAKTANTLGQGLGNGSFAIRAIWTV